VCGEEVFVAIVWGGFCFQEENWCWRTGAFNNATRKYGGLIFTSQRAVEGFAQMIEEEKRCGWAHGVQE
jgi:uroporphyrinogen-III synthase